MFSFLFAHGLPSKASAKSKGAWFGLTAHSVPSGPQTRTGKATCRHDPSINPLYPILSFSCVWLSLSPRPLLRLSSPLCHRVPSNSLTELFVYLKDCRPIGRPGEEEVADPTHLVQPIGAAHWWRHGRARYPALLGQCVFDQLRRVTWGLAKLWPVINQRDEQHTAEESRTRHVRIFKKTRCDFRMCNACLLVR